MQIKRAFFWFLAIYTSEKSGNDESGLGTEEKPFKTILQAMRHAGTEPFPVIYVDGKENVKYEPASKSQLKKIQKIWVRESHKQADASKREEEDAAKREKNLEEAKKIIISEDKSLPEAKLIKISKGKEFRDKRVKIYGWVHRLRRQGKNLMFITLRDGTGFLQSVLTDKLCQTYNAVILSTESSIILYGTLKEVPEGKTVRYLTKKIVFSYLIYVNRHLEVMNLL